MQLSSSSTNPSASDYYKSWVGYEALIQAVDECGSYRTVWNLLHHCDCCSIPHCWNNDDDNNNDLPEKPIPKHLISRIRWYDHVPQQSGTSTTCTRSSNHLVAEQHHSVRLREHFVSHHQRIELILYALQPSLNRIDQLVLEEGDLRVMDEQRAKQIHSECQYAASGWMSIAEMMTGVAKIDRIQYLEYVPHLAGVSGGNSPNMMVLSSRTGTLEKYFCDFSDDELATAIRTQSPAGKVAEAFMDLLDALSRCWMQHVVTATTSIGITRGTKGTPNTILVERVLHRLHHSRLLRALGSLRAPLTGIGSEMVQLYEYQNYALAEHYLDLFEDPGCEFGTHSFGFPPKIYETARNKFIQLRRAHRSSIWKLYYEEIRPNFVKELRKLLNVDDIIDFGLGSSVTEVLSRLLLSLPTNIQVLIPEGEFVSNHRAAAILAQKGAAVTQVDWGDLESARYRNWSDSNDEKKHDTLIRQIILVSMIDSCTQRVLEIDWIRDAPLDAIIVLDVTQAVANIPLNLCDVAKRPNVFVVGSLIKHARCGEGLGFMTYYRCSDNLIETPASGWTAFLSGLRENRTLDEKSGQLLYDTGLEWDGGTPSCAEAAYVATQILKSLPCVEMQHCYVQTIKDSFMELASSLLTPRQVASISISNTMALPVSTMIKGPLRFGIDYKVVRNSTFLRIGFGIHNLRYHLQTLINYIKDERVLN